jgi:FkbM family methyltransferase
MIYDFGANNGSNLRYYLSKDSVVAAEANARLCAAMSVEFADDVRSGRLHILNVALAETEGGDPVAFYIHKTNHVLSQLPRPANIGDFDEVAVASRTPASIVREYGEPSYIKVDVEYFDAALLKNLFDAGIVPPEISAEAHSVETFALMVVAGYRSFNLVAGATVTKLGFPAHSAGPFGSDIAGPWEDPDTFLHTLASRGLGWKDIHASRVIPPAPRPSAWQLAARQIRGIANRGIERLRRTVSTRP